MNTRKSLYDVKSFYSKKAVLKASFQGMRYQVEQVVDGEEKQLKATVWPEPFCYERANPESMKSKTFLSTEDGLDEVYQWLCTEYEERRLYWEHARDYPLEGIL